MNIDIKNFSLKEVIVSITSIFIITLLSSFTKEEVSPVESKILEVPKNKKCEVVFYDENAGNIIDDSIDLEVLAQGFEIAEGPLWVASKKCFFFLM